MLIFGAVTKSYITRMFKSNSGEPYAGKLHVRFLEEFISNCLIIREGENLLMPCNEVYKILNSTGILDHYIIPYYDVLHTLGKEYLVEDITDFVREKGIRLV